MANRTSLTETAPGNATSPLLLPLPLPQIIFGRPRSRARRSAIRVERVLGDGDDAAVLAHLQYFEPAVGAAEHPVLACKLGGDALDRAPGAERLAATACVARL